MSEVVLLHRREHDMFTGSIVVTEGKKSTTFYEFRHMSFKDMVTRFAEVLREHPDHAAVFHRTDRAGLTALSLDKVTADLLRNDPVQAIRQMDAPAVVVNLKTDVPVEAEKPQIGLRIGHSSFADSFGDKIYCRGQGAQIECPGCGTWCYTETLPHGTTFTCWSCNQYLRADRAGDSWWTVNTSALLTDFRQTRYFLARTWNKNPPWISHEDLQKKYDDFLKEKSDV